MKTAQEITSSLNNLKFYSSKIKELTKLQFEEDFKRGQELGINSNPGSIRFDCLGEIAKTCTIIDVYCDNIAINLESAVKQDRLLHTEEIEKE